MDTPTPSGHDIVREVNTFLSWYPKRSMPMFNGSVDSQRLRAMCIELYTRGWRDGYRAKSLADA